MVCKKDTEIILKYKARLLEHFDQFKKSAVDDDHEKNSDFY